MILGSDNLTMPLRLAAVMVPVALYFLILGLLNTRRNPQLLKGWQDFALLAIALCPLWLVPIVNWLGASLWVLAGCAAVTGVAVLALAPRGLNWVIYNVSAKQALAVVGQALRNLGLDYEQIDEGFALHDGGHVTVKSFALLSNVSVRLSGGPAQLATQLPDAICHSLGRVENPASPMAMSMLLVATAMLVAPLAMVAPRVPEIVRLLTDLVK